MTLTITSADILSAARNCDWCDAARAYRIVNNAGDGFDPECDHLGVLVGSQDGLSVYDDNGDAVIVGDAHGAWAVRVYADKPVTFTDEA